MIDVTGISEHDGDATPGDQMSTNHHEHSTDSGLLSDVAHALASVHQEPPGSFVLHAPLELMARAELLPQVSPLAREQARRRIVDIATAWSATDTPTRSSQGEVLDDPLDALSAALAEGDIDAADHAYRALCRQRSTAELIADLAGSVLPHLGGAGHGSIFFELLPRFAPPGVNPALMARTLVADLARHPDWRLTWIDQPRPRRHRTDSLTGRLLAPTSDEEPESTFIHPTMSLIDGSGLAAEVLGDVTLGLSVTQARGELLRVAAQSMLQDDPAHAPYGWTHCLTLPHAALAIAESSGDPQRAIDIAATYVLGFRATQSAGAIDPNWQPPPPTHLNADTALEAGPDTAAAYAWHATSSERSCLAQAIVDYAATHQDAHLAKYTAAAFHAARLDPAAAHLFGAASAYLAAWWHQHDNNNPT